jgi:hypothetical protein
VRVLHVSDTPIPQWYREGIANDVNSEFQCPSTNAPLCLGSKTEEVIKMTVPKAYEGKIKSAKCNKL